MSCHELQPLIPEQQHDASRLMHNSLLLSHLLWTAAAVGLTNSTFASLIASEYAYSGQLQHGSVDSGEVLQELVGAGHTQQPPCTSKDV